MGERVQHMQDSCRVTLGILIHGGRMLEYSSALLSRRTTTVLHYISLVFWLQSKHSKLTFVATQAPPELTPSHEHCNCHIELC